MAVVIAYALPGDLGVHESGDGIGRPPEIPTERSRGEEPAWIPRPNPISNGVLGMMALLCAEVMLFAGLVGAFIVFRIGSLTWPPPEQPRLPIGVTGLNTLILTSSLLPLARALKALRRGDRTAVTRGLAGALALGLVFVTVQGSEWVRLLGYGLTLSSSVYGGLFYVIIGAHAAHVLGAVLWLAVILWSLRAPGRALPTTGAKLAAVYWSFVVGLWPILYILVYLT